MAWSSLLYDPEHHVIRGLAFRTKTSKRGMPFAIQAQGISGFWGSRWLLHLDKLWSSLEEHFPSVALPPESSRSGGIAA